MVYTDDQLKKLHLKLMVIMNELDRVCKKYNITYYLAYGTLLGAVRHKGFIPWDDDLDIVLFRKDYDKLVNLDVSEFQNGVFIQSCTNTPGYGHVFAKAMLSGTLNIENFAENVNCHKNIYIDIFPIDTTSASGLKLKIQNKMCLLYSKLMLLNTNYKFTKTGIKKVIYSLGYWISHHINKDLLYSKWLKWAKKYSDINAVNCMSMVSIYPLRKELLPLELFKETDMYDFENVQLQSLKDYDKYLKIIYGDYMELPPLEKRIAKHNSIQIDFGE